MKHLPNRRIETTVYILGWILIVGIMLLDMMRTRSYTETNLLTPELLTRLLAGVCPFIILFLVNNYLLIPRLLLRNRQVAYLIAALAAIAIVWGLQGTLHHPGHPHPGPPPFLECRPRPLFSFPRFLDFTYDLLIVGINLAIALMFRRYDERLELESRRKAAAENRLNYLKAQINPHFYMNMLNNIHGMIEINPPKAQEMVLDLSRLMRYLLYDSSRMMVPLEAELDFIRNYLRLMRIRYPENKLRITCELPETPLTSGVDVPPLLFLVYIENAFKHGVSYRRDSFIDISIRIRDNRVEFSCVNSFTPSASPHTPGIGLRNSAQRLRLIYGDDCALTTSCADDRYTVTLSIPSHEDSHSNS